MSNEVKKVVYGVNVQPFLNHFRAKNEVVYLFFSAKWGKNGSNKGELGKKEVKMRYTT